MQYYAPYITKIDQFPVIKLAQLDIEIKLSDITIAFNDKECCTAWSLQGFHHLLLNLHLPEFGTRIFSYADVSNFMHSASFKTCILFHQVIVVGVPSASYADIITLYLS